MLWYLFAGCFFLMCVDAVAAKMAETVSLHYYVVFLSHEIAFGILCMVLFALLLKQRK